MITGKKIGAYVSGGIAAAVLVAAPSALAAVPDNNSVTSAKIVDQSIQSVDIAANAVGTSEIRDQTILSVDIAADGVGASEIRANAVGSSEINADAVGASEIVSNGVGASEIAANAVGSSEIATGAVGDDEATDDLTIASSTGVSATTTVGGEDSHQAVWGDFNIEADFEGTYGAGMMGNVIASAALTASDNSYVAGVIGKYTVEGANPSDHPSGGVVGEIGDGSGVSNTADGAVIAVMGGDSGAVTGGAAFKVMNQNSTAGSGFAYGLDLFNAGHDGFLANDQIIDTADIRLQNGETISNETDGTIAFGAANLSNSGSVTSTGAVNFSGASALRVPAIAADLADGADAGSTCAAGNSGDIRIDNQNNFFGCDGTNWQQLD